jgi:hypothetical protein
LLLDLQVTAGNAAVSRLVRERSIAIQRKVGFEFETSGKGWTVGVPKKPLTFTQMEDPSLTSNVLKKPVITKGKSLMRGQHYELQADESNVAGAHPHIEFVTTLPPFEETDQGRQELVDSLKHLRSVMDHLESRRTNMGFIRVRDIPGGTEALPGSGVMPEGASNLTFSPQVTAGIGLNKIGSLFTEIGKQKPRDQQKDATSDLMGMGDELTVGQAPEKAKEAIQQEAYFHGRSSPELIGLVSLLVTYIYKSRQQFSYPKLIAPIMARTDMATLFRQLKTNEIAFFKTFPDRFANLVFAATGDSYQFGLQETMPINADVDMFPKGLATGELDQNRRPIFDRSICGKLTLGRWLTEIPKGTDLLTKFTFPSKSQRSKLESMGSLRDHLEDVGSDGSKQAAPVFELRRIQNKVTPERSIQIALDAFDYIRNLNSGAEDPHYTRTRNA